MFADVEQLSPEQCAAMRALGPQPDTADGARFVLTPDTAGVTLRRLIRASGLNMTEVAARCGVKHQTLVKYLDTPSHREAQRIASLKILHKIASVCGGSIVLVMPTGRVATTDKDVQ